MKALIAILMATLVLAYPLVVFYGLQHFELSHVLLVLMILAVARVVMECMNKKSIIQSTAFWTGLLLLLLVSVTWLMQQTVYLKLYPVAVNLIFFVVFALSLKSDKSMIQRFAEFKEKNITGEKKRYMENLTLVWCGFFIVNGLISAYTVWLASEAVWALYNGLISYLLMGLLFGVELIYRHQVVLKKNQ